MWQRSMRSRYLLMPIWYQKFRMNNAASRYLSMSSSLWRIFVFLSCCMHLLHLCLLLCILLLIINSCIWQFSESCRKCTYVGNNQFCRNFGRTHYCFFTKCKTVVCTQYVNYWIASPLNLFTVQTHQVYCCRSRPNPLSRPVEVSIVSLLRCPYLAQSHL